MKKITCFLGLYYCFVFSGTLPAQEIPGDIKSNPLYSNIKEIINGPKWTYDKKYSGTSLLTGISWATGDVLYNGTRFEGIKMNYDLYTNEFIIFIPDEDEKKYVALSKESLEGFSFQDTVTGRKRYFEYSRFPGTSEKRLYEIAYDGESRFLICRNVLVSGRIANGFLGEYTHSMTFYLKSDGQFRTFSTQKELLKLLGDHTSELKRYIHSANLKINKKNYADIARLIGYSDKQKSLNRTGL